MYLNCDYEKLQNAADVCEQCGQMLKKCLQKLELVNEQLSDMHLTNAALLTGRVDEEKDEILQSTRNLQKMSIVLTRAGQLYERSENQIMDDADSTRLTVKSSPGRIQLTDAARSLRDKGIIFAKMDEG